MTRQCLAPYDTQDLPNVSAAIENLLAEYGLPATIKALVRAMVRRPQRLDVRGTRMTDHLRADIGLLPEPTTRNYWELR